jgi:hypothetical protein
MARAQPIMIPAEPTPLPADCLEAERIHVSTPLTVTVSP